MGRRERKVEKRKQILMASILVFLMVASGFGVIVGSRTSEMKYGKYKFQIINNKYVTEINGNDMPFYFLPSQVDYINLSSTITNKLKEAFLIMLTFNPDDKNNIQFIEVTRFDLSTYFGKVVYNGVFFESDEYELPVLTCANATIKTPVIIFNTTEIINTPSIVEENNCIYLNARGTDFLRLRDRMLYSYHGVIQDE
ncbi:hypothetical protein KY348_01635 [Candidatus Woesearchaeota archaeon]|nr:hypothetical protein [Candidatus Woesearchaeota archaeon]